MFILPCFDVNVVLKAMQLLKVMMTLFFYYQHVKLQEKGKNFYET